MKYCTITFLSLIMALAISCGKEQPAVTGSPDANKQFEDETARDLKKEKILSQYEIIDNSFKIQIPEDWPVSDSKISDRLKKDINSSNTYFKSSLVKTYNSKDMSFCIISKITDSRDVFGCLNKDFTESLTKSSGTLNIQKDQFKLDGNDVVQYRIINDTFVTFKMYFKSGSFYQLDFVIPKKVYDKQIKKVALTIASVKFKI